MSSRGAWVFRAIAWIVQCGPHGPGAQAGGMPDAKRVDGGCHVVHPHDAGAPLAPPPALPPGWPPDGPGAARPVSAPSVDLRDQPTSSGRPSASNSCCRAAGQGCAPRACRTRCRGRARCARAATPARMSRCRPLARKAPTSRTTSSIVGRIAASSAGRRACASGRRRRPRCAATSIERAGPAQRADVVDDVDARGPARRA